MSVAARTGSTVWQRTSVRSLAVLLPAAAVAAVMVGKWPLIDSGADRLGSADRGWLALAALAALFTWVCAAAAQQGAVVERLPPGRLAATQFAASAANHVLPAGVGGNAVNLRFLVRHGLTPTRAVAALAVRASAAGVARLAMLLGVLVLFPGALHIRRVTAAGRQLSDHALLLACAVVLLSACLFALSRRTRALRVRLRAFLTSVVADVRALHHSRARTAALWGGSFAFPAMHAAVVVAVMRAVHAPVPAGGVVVAYLCASTATGWVPTPAGFGSLDAALGLALVTAGASGVTATSAVLGYRLVTTWLPLIPGAIVLAVLVRCREL